MSEPRPQRPRRAPTRLDNGGDTAALQQVRAPRRVPPRHGAALAGLLRSRLAPVLGGPLTCCCFVLPLRCG